MWSSCSRTVSRPLGFLLLPGKLWSCCQSPVYISRPHLFGTEVFLCLEYASVRAEPSFPGSFSKLRLWGQYLTVDPTCEPALLACPVTADLSVYQGCLSPATWDCSARGAVAGRECSMGWWHSPACPVPPTSCPLPPTKALCPCRSPAAQAS